MTWTTPRPWRARRPVLLLALVATIAPLSIACGDDHADQSPSTATSRATKGAAAVTPSQPSLEGEITVFAASSLTDAFKEAGREFEALHPKTSVRFNFAASSALATQINEGGPADVFASADNAQMKAVVDAGNAANPRQFASNVPAVVVPKASSVATFGDLARPGLLLVLAAPEVPVGRYAREILSNASKAGGIAPDFSDRVLANLKSNEANVRAVLSKVALGEADAGIVYSTDAATAADDVTTIEIPVVYNVIAQYPIAVVTPTAHTAAAEAWVAFILGPEGQAILARYGFGKPTPS